MTRQTDFSARLDDLQERVAAVRTAAQIAAAESDAQLRHRIDRAQADLTRSIENGRQQVSRAPDSARAKWVQLKADTLARMSKVRANMNRRDRQVDARLAVTEADWSEADAVDALDFADMAVKNAHLTMLDAIHARALADYLAKTTDLK